MVFSWLSGGEGDVAELIAKKSYGRAAKTLHAQLKREPSNASLRQQLADVLLLDGQPLEAVEILLGLADELARGGFVAKSIAVLKKIQRIEPGRLGVEQRLARLMKERDEEESHRQRLRQGGRRLREEALSAAQAAEPGPEEQAPLRPEETAPAAVPVPPEPEPLVASGVEPVADAAEREAATVGTTSLFSDFSRDELAAVIAGLRLQTFEPGDMIVSEGEEGNSLFVVSSGTVKAFVRDLKGHPHKIREMYEGAFFGEVSVLTGRPRSATVTAATACELLELDRATLEEITAKHPNVQTILWDFCEARMDSQDELRARLARNGPRPGSE